MINKWFDITLNPARGTIVSIVNRQDATKMNWCADQKEWGKIYCKNISDPCDPNGLHARGMELQYFEQDEVSSCSVYTNGQLEATVLRSFDSEGSFSEKYIIRNLSKVDTFVEHGAFSVAVPFNDCYTDAETCMVKHCNTHLWCGNHTTYVKAEKMGPGSVNLGLVLHRGAVSSYSIKDCCKNHRGEFLFDCEHLELLSGETYVLEWKMFWYDDAMAFMKEAQKSDQFIFVEAEHHTVFETEEICFTAEMPKDTQQITVWHDEEMIDYVQEGRKIKVKHKPKHSGEHKFWICADGVRTYTEFFVAEPFEELLKKRLSFIVQKQQYHRKSSHLDGAYLIYDNAEKQCIFEYQVWDHNASRERIGMALLIARYLQTNDNPILQESLEQYLTFLKREMFDEATGKVFGNIGKDESQIRLYNAPWVAMLYTEVFFLKKDKMYLEYVKRILKSYYEGGGDKFYPNGMDMYSIVQAFKEAGLLKEMSEIVLWFKQHVDNIVSNGIKYPKHEVNYEQTIVSPATAYTCQMYRITGEEKYKAAASEHVSILKRFSGKQPSFHLKEIPIRYWDDFWFGKSRTYGDTFPHYWSCLSARGFLEYFNITGDRNYYTQAEECMRNCLCLFNSQGEGSCAYVYPYMVNGAKGMFYDEWANDQDFALYFALKLSFFEEEKNGF